VTPPSEKMASIVSCLLAESETGGCCAEDAKDNTSAQTRVEIRQMFTATPWMEVLESQCIAAAPKDIAVDGSHNEDEVFGRLVDHLMQPDQLNEGDRNSNGEEEVVRVSSGHRRR